MKYLVSIVASIVLLAWPCLAAAEVIKVVIYGDSLTSGYQLQPDEAFGIKLDKKIRDIGFKDVQVTNLSVSNYTTADSVKNLDDMLRQQPDIVIVAFGMNDIVSSANPNAIHQNVSYILSKLYSARAYTILIGVKAPASLGATYGQQVDAVYHSLAIGYKVAFYPNALEGIAEKSKYTLADGYHPNAQGVDIMVEGVYRLVDAGLRWKLDVLRYQEEYRKSLAPKDSGE